MANQIILKFSGSLAPDDLITARTLSHSLQSLQRAVDKIVLYERRGTLRKFDTLPGALYSDADFLVQQFQPGCIQIPLVNDAAEYLATRLRGILREPYELAVNQHERAFLPLIEQLPAAYDRALHADPEQRTHQALIEHPEVEREYANVAILKEISNLISPLRSSRTTVDDSITLTVADRDHSANFVFDKPTSKRFKDIVSSKKLGLETVYRGYLTGLEETNYNGFPYAGKFSSLTTECEVKLLIHSQEAALALSPYNLKPDVLSFWGAPITTYGAFDEVRGDIVFLELIE